MRILKEFWYGNIELKEYDTSYCKEYKKLLERRKAPIHCDGREKRTVFPLYRCCSWAPNDNRLSDIPERL